MILYRDRTYLAIAVVRRAAENAAVVEVLKETQKGEIRKGDQVSTSLDGLGSD